MKERTECWNCKYLEYYEKECYEDSSPEGYYCDYRDTEHFKTFPCNRRLKCFKAKRTEE